MGRESVKNTFMKKDAPARQVTGSLPAYEALEKLRNQAGMSKRSFVLNFLGLANAQNYTHWSKYGVPHAAVLGIASQKGLNAKALLEGLVVEEGNVVPVEVPLYKVPVISWVRAGNFDTLLDQHNVEEVTEYVYLDKKPGPRGFALRVRGPSMESRFQDRDFIVVDPDVPWESGDFVILGNHSDEATFKQIVQVDGEWWARPLNPQFVAKKLDPTCRVIGRVIWHQKPGTAV